MTNTTADLTTMTPVEIDTILADLYGQAQALGNKVEHALNSVMHAADAKRLYGRGQQWSLTATEAVAKVREIAATDTTYVGKSAQRAVDAYDEARAALAANRAEQATVGAEFTRRGGWTRAFLVTDGHVHSSMDCSTCNNGIYATQFSWLVEFSGGTEADVVAAAADRACTVCYPSAPVETAGRSTLMTPDERTRAEQRDAAAVAKAERDAKRIAKALTADGSEFVVRYHWLTNSTGEHFTSERFKTEQAATTWVVGAIAEERAYGYKITDGKRDAMAQVVEAIRAKHDWTQAEVDAHIDAKVAAKIKRDAR